MITYIIWDVEPGIFEGVEFLRWYSVSWVLGMLLGYKIMLDMYKSEGIPPAELDTLVTYVMLGGILGARLGHVLFYDPIYYLNNPVEILPIKINPTFQFTGLAGLASHGGVFGALFALYLYHRKYKRNYIWMLDRLIIAGAALGGCIRLGNLMNSEIIGIPSQLPWAFVFARVDDIPRHPAQLYEAVFYLGISTTLYFIWKSKRFYAHNGFIIGLGMTLIFAQRFIIEFLKENQVSFEENLALNMGQTLSIPLVFSGIILLIWSLTTATNQQT
ncbi:MAG: prolipoprotein diacylglyceryl transferase [Cyclobacteriaceae bacterium]